MQYLSLLIVDDEPTIRMALKAWFTTAGYDVTTADGGRSAVELCRETEFSAIILDVEMPCMNGMESLNAIRQIRPHVPIIMLTGNPEAAHGALTLGACRVLTKPMRMGDLERHVRQCVAATATS